MEENNNTPESNVKSTIDAVTGLVQAIPVYQDTLQPAAKQVGQSLETVAKAVNIALAPVGVLVWGYEQIKDFVTTRVTEKLKNTPKENITTPPPQVAGPAIEALRYTGHQENLRELYANLLATAMDKETSHNAHPAYVDVIKNMTPDEALLLTAFESRSVYPIIDITARVKDSTSYRVIYSGYGHFHKSINFQNPLSIPVYLNNLSRLGILEMPADTHITAPNTYEPLETDAELQELKESIQKTDRTVSFDRRIVQVTTFGRRFIDNVVIDKK